MQLITFLLVATLSQVAATGYSQKISLDQKNVSIETALKAIEKQTDYLFLYDKLDLPAAKKVSVQVRNATIEQTLNRLFQDLPLSYKIFKKNIVIKKEAVRKEESVIPETQAPVLEQTVKGRITDEKGEGLPGVNILLKGTQSGTTSDSQGAFSVEVPDENTVLIFSFVGYVSQEIIVGTKTDMDVTMAADQKALDEVVVVGYGTQRKADLTGAVTVVKMNDIRGASASTGNVMKGLDGHLAGTQVSYSGNPNAAAGVLIRGMGTLNNTSPLYVIDGIPTTRGLNEIAANDIESIQVLKDASAATIYGSRAANGVFIITTKKAKQGSRLQFSSSTTANFLPKNPLPLLNTDQYGRAQWMAARNDGVDPNYGVYRFEDHRDASGAWALDRIILPEYLDDIKTMRPGNTDWQKEISRTGISQNYNASFSSGTEKGRALLALDYFDNQGTTKENKWNRISVRLNSDYLTLGNRLKVGEDISIIKMYSTGGNHLTETRNLQSIVPVHTIDGVGWGGPVMGMSDRLNPLLSIMRNKQNRSDDVRIFGSIFADLQIIKNLHFKSAFGIDKIGHWQRNMYTKYTAGFMSEDVTKMEQWSSFGGSWTWNNVLTYDFSKGKNAFTVMAGQEAVYESGADMYGARDGFAIEDPDYMYLNVGETNVRNGGGAYDNSLNSYFGKGTYNFSDRFLVTAIVRLDGSSRFGKNNRYSTFPSLSGGWVLSEEQFIKSIPLISYLKVRYGWGKTGNQAIDNYASWGQYQAHYGDDDWPLNNGTAYDIYGNDTGPLPSGYRRLSLGNSNLKWETTTQNNFGVDISLFNSKFNATFDYYYKNTSDILVYPPYLSTIGPGGGQWVNGATMKNWGFEFMASYTNNVGEVGYTISANATHNKNRITSLPEAAVGGYPGNGNDQVILGRPYNSFYGWVSDGIFQNQAEVDAAPVQPGKGVGRMKFRDVNQDNKIDADDRTWIGVNEPKVYGGINVRLNWKSFDFSMLWRTEIGRMVNNIGIKSYTHFFGFFGGQNYGTAVLDSWSPTNTTSTIPAISASDQNNEQRFSSYFVENASYIKLGSMELGYSLPQSLVKNSLISGGRIYVQGQNLWTIKGFGKNPFSGFDPQSPNENFPIPTALTFGFNLTF